MGSFIGDVANSFRPGTLDDPVERNFHGITGIVGVIMSVALAVFGAPVVLWAVTGAIFSTLIFSATIESKGLAYASYIALFGLGIAISALTPLPPLQGVWVIY